MVFLSWVALFGLVEPWAFFVFDASIQVAFCLLCVTGNSGRTSTAAIAKRKKGLLGMLVGTRIVSHPTLDTFALLFGHRGTLIRTHSTKYCIPSRTLPTIPTKEVSHRAHHYLTVFVYILQTFCGDSAGSCEYGSRRMLKSCFSFLLVAAGCCFEGKQNAIILLVILIGVFPHILLWGSFSPHLIVGFLYFLSYPTAPRSSSCSSRSSHRLTRKTEGDSQCSQRESRDTRTHLRLFSCKRCCDVSNDRQIQISQVNSNLPSKFNCGPYSELDDAHADNTRSQTPEHREPHPPAESEVSDSVPDASTCD